jgi:DegV family protein with EDD domain
MRLRIVTDSTCDLPEAVIREHRISVVPVLIGTHAHEYRDGIDLSRREFYEQLPGMNPAPVTAAPSPETFRRAYEQLAAEGATQVLSIHMSHKLSAVVDVARLGAGETTATRVTVFDSRQLSLGTGYQVLQAAEAAAAGRSLQEIVLMLEAQIARTHVFAALDTLEYIRRGGRMNIAISALGNLLQIKPLLKMYDGDPAAERVRTRAAAMKRLQELLARHAPYEKAALLHSGAEERARAMLEQVRPLLPPGEVWVEEINPVLGAHLGPGVIGFAGISKQR